MRHLEYSVRHLEYPLQVCIRAIVLRLSGLFAYPDGFKHKGVRIIEVLLYLNGHFNVFPIQLVETMPQTKEVEEFLKAIGPFYEVADDDDGDNDSLDPTAQVAIETKSPPTPSKDDSPPGNEEDSNEVTNRNSSPPSTNQTSEPGEEVEGDGGEGGSGESGDESDMDFKDSFQDLKVCITYCLVKIITVTC